MAYLAVSMNLFEVELYKKKGGKGKVKDCHGLLIHKFTAMATISNRNFII